MGSLTDQEEKRIADDGDELVAVVKAKVGEWFAWSGPWIKEARESYDFVAGQQWTEEEKTQLESAKRIPIVMNRIAAFVRGVCGLEVSNRQEVRYMPREQGDAAPNEVINAAAAWVRDECYAADEESESFRDMVITGMGWVETRMDYENDPEGMIFIERRDPLRCAWDMSASKRGLTDASWVAHWQDYTQAEFETLWPDKAEDISATLWPDEGAQGQPHDADRAPWYSNDEINTPLKNHVRVVRFQYYKTTVAYKVEDFNGQVIELDAAKFKRVLPFVKARGLKFAKIKRREYRQCFVAGDTLLDDIPLGVSGFTLRCLTGTRDRNKGFWYGLVRDAKDPQKWANKFFSLQIDIMSTSSKGGLMAETNAFEDNRAAEEAWANPHAVLWTQPGALQSGKIQLRPTQAIPPQLQQMLSTALEALPQVMGINLEFLGLADRAQAGVLEHQRKQAAITTLAEFFSALRLYRIQQGRILLEFINQFLSDGRLIRVVGAEGEKYVPLMKQEGFTKYDTIVDEAPSSPDVKGRAWMALSEIMPAMLKIGMPVPPEVLDYAPIPSSLTMKWKALLNAEKQQQQQQLPPEHMQAMQQMGEQMQKLTEENQKLKTDRSLKQMELQAQREEAMQKLAMEKEEAVATLQLKREIAEYDAQLKALAHNSDAEIQNAKLMAETEAKFKRLDAERTEREKRAEMERETTQQSSEGSDDSGLKASIDALTRQVMAMAGEEKKDDPKSVQMVYGKDGSLTEAVLTKTDGKIVRVKVARSGKPTKMKE